MTLNPRKEKKCFNYKATPIPGSFIKAWTNNKVTATASSFPLNIFSFSKPQEQQKIKTNLYAEDRRIMNLTANYKTTTANGCIQINHQIIQQGNGLVKKCQRRKRGWTLGKKLDANLFAGNWQQGISLQPFGGSVFKTW